MEMITSADASLPSFLERDDADMLYTDDSKERDETFIYIVNKKVKSYRAHNSLLLSYSITIKNTFMREKNK